MTEDLTKETFLKKVFNYEENEDWKYEGDVPAIVDFWAPWCGPCQTLGPILENLSEEYAGRVKFYKINVDEEEELTGLFGIRSIPSILFIPIQGKPKIAVGALPREIIVEAIDKELNVQLS